jgi:hypothetical protein
MDRQESSCRTFPGKALLDQAHPARRGSAHGQADEKWAIEAPALPDL